MCSAMGLPQGVFLLLIFEKRRDNSLDDSQAEFLV